MSTENTKTESIDTAGQAGDPSWLNDLVENRPTDKKAVFVRAAVKRHFLEISKKTRNGKFNRVSQEAIDKLEVAFEAKLRSFQAEVQDLFGQVEPSEVFLTQEGKKKVLEAFNVWLAREMHRHVKGVRVGKTL